MVNTIIQAFGGEPIAFLSDPKWFRTVYVGSEVWQNFGWDSVVFLAALTGIDMEQFEAAKLDGASRWQTIWHISLPSILPTVVTMLLMRIGHVMSIGFEKAYALQTDMNLPASEILSTYVYRIGLLNGDYGYSTAVGLFNSIVNVILLVAVNWIVAKLNDGEGI